jgi:hypothetical protein
MHVMQVAVVKVVHVTVMPDRGMTAVGPMLVGVVGMMRLVAGHDRLSLVGEPI